MRYEKLNQQPEQPPATPLPNTLRANIAPRLWLELTFTENGSTKYAIVGDYNDFWAIWLNKLSHVTAGEAARDCMIDCFNNFIGSIVRWERKPEDAVAQVHMHRACD